MQWFNSSGMNDASYKRRGVEGGKLQVWYLAHTKEKPQGEAWIPFVLRGKGRRHPPLTTAGRVPFWQWVIQPSGKIRDPMVWCLSHRLKCEITTWGGKIVSVFLHWRSPLLYSVSLEGSRPLSSFCFSRLFAECAPAHGRSYRPKGRIAHSNFSNLIL